MKEKKDDYFNIVMLILFTILSVLAIGIYGKYFSHNTTISMNPKVTNWMWMIVFVIMGCILWFIIVLFGRSIEEDEVMKNERQIGNKKL